MKMLRATPAASFNFFALPECWPAPKKTELPKLYIAQALFERTFYTPPPKKNREL